MAPLRRRPAGAVAPLLLALQALGAGSQGVCEEGTLSLWDVRSKWREEACPPLPSPDGSVSATLQCNQDKLTEDTTVGFYIRRYYEALERVSHRVLLAGEDWRNREVIEALEALDRLLCTSRFLECFEDQSQMERMHYRCDRVDRLRILKPFDCEAVFSDPDAVVKAIEGLGDRVVGVPERNDPPKEPQGLVAVIVPYGYGIVWNVGVSMSGDDVCRPGGDLGLCLVKGGWGGILVDGNPATRDHVRAAMSARSNVALLSEEVEPRGVARDLDDAMWNNVFLRGNPVTVLKIDLGSGDCHILEAILAHGVRPYFLHVTFWDVVPPPLAYTQHYSPREEGDEAGSVNSRGFSCSLQAVAEIAGSEYGFYGAPHASGSAEFVRRDVAKDMGLEVLADAGQALQDYWYVSFVRQPQLHNRRVFDALSLDPRILRDRSVPMREKMQLLRWHLEGTVAAPNTSLYVPAGLWSSCAS